MSINIVALDHIQLAMPPSQEEAARQFYADILGLTEIAKPPTLVASGGCWFAGQGVALHLGTESPFTPARKAHPAFRVADLEAAIVTLRAEGIAVKRDERVPTVRRVYIADPFGNRIELLQDGDVYPSGEG